MIYISPALKKVGEYNRDKVRQFRLMELPTTNMAGELRTFKQRHFPYNFGNISPKTALVGTLQH